MLMFMVLVAMVFVGMILVAMVFVSRFCTFRLAERLQFGMGMRKNASSSGGWREFGACIFQSSDGLTDRVPVRLVMRRMFETDDIHAGRFQLDHQRLAFQNNMHFCMTMFMGVMVAPLSSAYGSASAEDNCGRQRAWFD